LLWAEQPSERAQIAEPQAPQTAPSNSFDILDQIPRFIDSTPTLLPAQSNEPTVPKTAETENNTWIDRNQKGIRNWADQTAKKIDNWFGDPSEEDAAHATIRILLDNSWNKYDGYEIKPRVRGRIKLPTLERKLSVVFGDDSLDNELSENVAITNENPGNADDKRLDKTRTRENNSSLALRWSQISE